MNRKKNVQDNVICFVFRHKLMAPGLLAGQIERPDPNLTARQVHATKPSLGARMAIPAASVIRHGRGFIIKLKTEKGDKE